MLTATPVLAMDLLLLGIEFKLDVGLFDPARGGDPLLFQHLFWFYSHPAVYIMILPAMGVVSELMPCFARQTDLRLCRRGLCQRCDRHPRLFRLGRINVLGGKSVYAGLIFSFMTFLVAVPSAIKVFNWTVSLYKGQISSRSADALCPRLYRAVYHRRRNRAIPRRRSPRRAHARTRISSSRISITSWSAASVSAFLRRRAFLVAEDHRPALPGNTGRDSPRS